LKVVVPHILAVKQLDDIGRDRFDFLPRESDVGLVQCTIPDSNLYMLREEKKGIETAHQPRCATFASTRSILKYLLDATYAISSTLEWFSTALVLAAS
jgi:hypothetical protein